MKGRYGTGVRSVRVWRHWLKLLVENSQSAKEMPITIIRMLSYNRSYPKTVLGPVPYPLCPVPGYDVGMVQKLESLELYDYLTLSQYPWFPLNFQTSQILFSKRNNFI